MQIDRLEIKGLFGYIDKDIFFKEDISLLVGINGSGKTSVLNIINWVLKPSIGDLCVTEFEEIRLSFTVEDNYYIIICKHSKHIFEYHLHNNNEYFSPLTVNVDISPCDLGNNDELKYRLSQGYSSLTPDEEELRTWNRIISFPKPTIIGLDRNLYAEENDILFLEEKNIRGKLVNKNVIKNSPLERVKYLVNTEYRKKKNAILNLTSELKNHLMLSTFDGSITLDSLREGIRHKLNINQIITVENRVNEYFENFERKALSKIEKQSINNYFKNLKEITTKYQDDSEDVQVKILYGLNANQFIKVNRLLKQFEKFEKQSAAALEQITIYLDTLNFFLKDSSKELLFNEETSEITFNTLDRKGKVLTSYKDIKFLSSGEQQILMLFSYIAFNTDGRVFIIDEPELSLHIKWQEDFLNQLERITPKATQLILATHSPILANKKKEKSILLLPFNT